MKNILKPTKIRIIVNTVFSLTLVLAFMFLSAFGLNKAVSTLSLGQKITSLLVNWPLSFVIYYPFVFGFIYIASSIKNSIYTTKEIILALVLIIIFNPWSISLIASKMLFRNSANNNVAIDNIQSESSCGFRINEILPNSTAPEAGIANGDIITKINDVQITSLLDIFQLLDQKRPGDKVLIETDKGLKTLELSRDLNDPNHPVLGVKLVPNPCKKITD